MSNADGLDVAAPVGGGTSGGGGSGGGSGNNKDDDKDDDEDGVGDDTAEFTTGGEDELRDAIQPRWPTRVFAAECLRRIIQGKFIKYGHIEHKTNDL